MSINLKALGLAIFAAFAMSAVAASAASAFTEGTAESYPTTLTEAAETGTVDVFTTTAGKVKCPNATSTGTMSASSSSVELTPNFNGPSDTCTSLAGIVPTIVDLNGCHKRITWFARTLHITCSFSFEITVTANQNTAHTLTEKCTIHIPPQTVGGLTFSNVGSGTTREIKVVTSATGITYTETAGSGLGACSTSTLQHDGTYTGTDLLTGETDAGSTHIGIFLS